MTLDPPQQIELGSQVQLYWLSMQFEQAKKQQTTYKTKQQTMNKQKKQQQQQTNKQTNINTLGGQASNQTNQLTNQQTNNPPVNIGKKCNQRGTREKRKKKT